MITKLVIHHTTEFRTVLLCLYVADPATFLASNSVLTIFSSESSLFIHLWINIYLLGCVITTLIM